MIIDTNLVHRSLSSPPADGLPYWTCQGRVFRTKLEALIYASEIHSDLEFRFNDDVLDSLDWTKEPAGDIEHYYTLRAQSIRDQYDYVVLMYSAGSDSSTILKTFLKAGIKIDEIDIYALWSDQISESKLLWNQELIHAGQDLLKMCAAMGIKIGHINLMDGISSLGTDDWIWNSDPLFTATQALRYRAVFDRPDLKRLVESGKKVALVFGHDKARIIVENKQFYHGFLDVSGMGCGIFPQMFDANYSGPSMELFYVNMQVPEIMIKQSHMIARWYWDNSGSRCSNLLSRRAMDPYYSSRANSIVYAKNWRENETYSLGKNQAFADLGHTASPLARKVSSWAWKCEWLYEDMKDTIYHDNWINGVRKALSMVDTRFLRHTKDGFIGHWSKFRKIIDFAD